MLGLKITNHLFISHLNWKFFFEFSFSLAQDVWGEINRLPSGSSISTRPSTFQSLWPRKLFQCNAAVNPLKGQRLFLGRWVTGGWLHRQTLDMTWILINSCQSALLYQNHLILTLFKHRLRFCCLSLVLSAVKQEERVLGPTNPSVHTGLALKGHGRKWIQCSTNWYLVGLLGG